MNIYTSPTMTIDYKLFVRIIIKSFPSASGRTMGKNKFLVPRAGIAMTDLVNLEFVYNPGQPLWLKKK